MDRAEVDVVILGAGCAGLSLGVRLAEQPGQCPRAVLLEARSAYVDDRTWCFWGLGPHRHDALVDHWWSRFTVRGNGRTVEADCAETPYQQLRAGAFYAASRAAIDTSRSVELRMGTRVGDVSMRADGGWTVATDAGDLQARAIVDTRPAAPPAAGQATLWQSFVGDEVESADDAFDPARATLMDFDDGAEAPGMVVFTYVLPTDRRRALVETTVFSASPIAADDLAARQTDAIGRACGGTAPRALRREHGILPMGLREERASPGRGYVHAGVAGGAARPATGYAFARIQRWADACAARLRCGALPIGHPRDPAMTRWMDALFLQVLASHPQRAPELFVRLFGRVDTARVVRFLSDCPTPVDRLAVIAALPPGVFLAQLGGGWPHRHVSRAGAA